jgi:mannose/cellobiose epimerase-like protein (N-acyl-D-glucosamine 2-epimerase family)
MNHDSAASAAGAAAGARVCLRQLSDWLLHKAYPLWSRHGVDHGNGGFYECLAPDGSAVDAPRRARVQPRQMYAFALAPGLGWHGDARAIVERAMAFLLNHYRRDDGLYRTLVAPDGSPLDSSALLYDQAFVLLGMASARRLLGPDPALEEAAPALLEALYSQLKRVGAGFYSGLPTRFPLLSNPHMHLLEAALAWCELSSDPAWRTLRDEITALALTHFIDPASGALRESFDEACSPTPGLEGRRVEPGHQFEWAWLLMRCCPEKAGAAWSAARKLIDIGEQYGVRQGFTVDALLDDLSIEAAGSRLWPQTERLKASALAAALTGERRYWISTAAAANTLLRYFDTATAGLWHDHRTAAGVFVPQPAPASSFYHIVASIQALTEALQE